MGQPRAVHGFTLVELIVVSALLLIVGGGLLTTFITGQTSYLSADAYVQVQQEARRAFDNVVRELREAGAETGQAITLANGNSQLNFQIAMGYNSDSVACPNAICWGSELPIPTGIGEWVHYGRIGTGNSAQLIRWRDTDPAGGTVPTSCTVATSCRVLANHVSSIIFTLSPAPPTPTEVIALTLQIQYNSPLLPVGSQATPSLTSQVKLRN